MTRAALAALLSLAAACSPDPPQFCPGEEVGRFTFDATLAATLDPGLDPDPSLPTCAAALGFPPTIAPFAGTLAGEPSTSAGALCRSTGVLFGTHSGVRWVVETSSGGAVLGACGSTCSATSRQVITGDVLPDLVNPGEFRGAFVEQLVRSEGACELCVLPCAARYVLHGTEASP